MNEIITENEVILNALNTAKHRLKYFKNIAVSISGGSDSDLVIDIVERCKSKGSKISYVFFNTGIEYSATHKHLDYLEVKYNIKIERIRPKKPIPISVKEYGVPFLSKHVSDMIGRLQKHNFNWKDKSFNELYEEYPKCKCALLWWCNEHPQGSMFNIDYNKGLKDFIIQNPPNFKISDKCCHYNKKEVIRNYIKEHEIDLDVTGLEKQRGENVL